MRPEPLTFAGLAAVLGLLLAGSWQRWGDLTIDCGGSVDLVARLATGDVLYRDVLSPYGPLPSYLIAGLMRVFGVHMNVVYGAGIFLLVAASFAWWMIVRRFLSEIETTAGLVAFWALLALQPGVFNWVLPNTFANSFGAFFALAMVTFLLDDLELIPRTRPMSCRAQKRP